MNKIIEEDINVIISDKNIDWLKFKDSSVLITGANGMLPSYMVYVLLHLNKRYNLNINVIALVRNKQKAYQKFADYLSDSHLTFLIQDVANKLNVNTDINYIIHAASQASPKYYEVDPVGTISANVLGTYNTLELASQKKVKSYLFFSTGEIYGVVPQKWIPFKEVDYGYIDLLKVRNCYGESKRLGENLCIAWNSQYKVPAKIVRIFHTYGPGMSLDDGRVFADFCKDIIYNNDIELHSKGNAVRSFIYISDATRAFFKILLDGTVAEAYNMANPSGEISINDLAQLLVTLYPEKKLQVKYKIETISESPILLSTPDCSKIMKLGWEPTISIGEGFKRTIDSFHD